NIEAAPTNVAVDRPESLHYLATSFSRAVCEGNINNITLITLHILKVLHEERFFMGTITVHRSLIGRIFFSQLLNRTIDLLALLRVHCNHSNRLFWSVNQVLQYTLRNNPCLFHISTIHKTPITNSCKLDPIFFRVRMGRRENYEIIVVILDV